MATTQEKWQEIANRGLQGNFDPQTRAKFDEAIKRGLISATASQGQELPQAEAEQPQQATGIDPQKVEQFKSLLLQQAKGVKGLDDQIASLQSELSGQQASRPERILPQPVEKPKQAPFIQDLFTGENRSTPELDVLPSLGEAPEFGEFSMANLKANIATFTTGDPEELKKIFKKQYGDKVSFTKDSKGNDIVNFPSGQYPLNRPGASAQDIPKFFGDLLAFTPAGKAKTITGAAIKGGIGETVLEGIDTALGGDFSIKDVGLSAALGGVFKGAEKIVSKVYGSLKGMADDIPATRDAAKKAFKESVTDEALEAVAETIKKGTNDDLAKLVDADPKFYQAADELGISTEPVAGFASRNPRYVTLESSLASVPTSQLEDQSKAFIRETSKKADDLIEQYGGTLDKGQLNLDFKRKATEVIDDLAQQADDVYSSLTKVLPKSERYAAPETISFIQSKIKELGGFKELPSKLKSIFNRLDPKTKTVKGKKVVNPATGAVSFSGAKSETINPTLGNIDQIRREIGQALNKKSGQFKDTEQGILKALYARLRTDQDAIAKAAGFQEMSKTANGLIIQRKQLEDNLKVLLGKDLNKALSINVAGALKGLAKSDITRFNQVMNAIPKKQRGEVVLTAMNDVFKGSGVDQQSLSPNQFVKWYNTINRSPAVKATLFSNLPKGSAKAINNLYIVSKGIEKSMGDRIHTGRLREMFNEDTGFLRQLVGRAAPSVVAISTGSPTASAMTNSAMQFLKQSTNGAKRASDLLSSTEFRELIKRSVSEGVVSGNAATAATLSAEKQLIKKSVFKSWRETLNKKQKEELKNLGLVKYLFAVTDREGNN